MSIASHNIVSTGLSNFKKDFIGNIISKEKVENIKTTICKTENFKMSDQKQFDKEYSSTHKEAYKSEKTILRF